MSEKRRKRHSPEQIVKKLRDADAMLSAGKDQAVVLQTLEVSESTLERWRKQYGGMKSEEAVRLKKLEEEKQGVYAQLVRRQADFENFRKRAEKEKQDFRQKSEVELLAKLLPVMDGFERALASESETPTSTAKAWSSFTSSSPTSWRAPAWRRSTPSGRLLTR